MKQCNNSVLHINRKGLELIKKYEGCSLRAYKCPAGILTIGYGHTGAYAKEDSVLSQKEADEILLIDLNYFEAIVYREIKNLNSNQFSALVSFCYNVGEKNFSTSTLLRLIKQNTMNPQIKDEFNRWVYAGKKLLPGLVRRRSEESELYFDQTVE